MFCSSSDWELTTEPYAHQRAAVEKLSRLNVGALFMDMGTGKTRTAIELVWLRRKLISKCVWCCPVSLKETVKREILRHTSCRDEDIHGSAGTLSAWKVLADPPACFPRSAG